MASVIFFSLLGHLLSGNWLPCCEDTTLEGSRKSNCRLTQELDLGSQRLLPVLEMYVLTTIPTLRAISGTEP